MMRAQLGVQALTLLVVLAAAGCTGPHRLFINVHNDTFDAATIRIFDHAHGLLFNQTLAAQNGTTGPGSTSFILPDDAVPYWFNATAGALGFEEEKTIDRGIVEWQVYVIPGSISFSYSYGD